MPKPLIIWGASGHAKVLREFCAALNYEIVALFDNVVKTSPFEGVPLFSGREGFQQWRASNPGDHFSGAVAIGGDRGRDRIEYQLFMRDHGVKIVQTIHPTAFVSSDAKLGSGCQILAQTAVCAEVSIGDAGIINTSASIDHECKLSEGVHIGPGATLAGCVEVGAYSFIGAGAVVLPRIEIGANAIVGAGSVVTRNVPDNAIFFGNPAQFRRWRTD